MKKYWKNINTNNHFSIGEFDFEFNLPYDIQKKDYRFIVEGIHSWDDIYDPSLNGIWKYSSVLPICQNTVEFQNHIAGDELSSPIELPEVASILNVKKFYVFPCTKGLSGTFKDIEASFVIGKIKEWNYQGPISFHSTGNTARAYREYAIKNCLDSIAFIPLSCVNKMMGASQDNHNKLALFNGPFQKISAFAKHWAKEHSYLHIAPLLWKVEGKTPLGYHIMRTVPDTTHIIQTIAGGYGILGIYQAIKRLMEWDICQKQPEFLLFQLCGADSFSQLMSKKTEIHETDLKIQNNPFESTLQSTNPLSTFEYVRSCCEDTKSSIYSSEVSSIIKYSEEFITICEHNSIPISFIDEKSPFISYAGLRKYASEKRFKGDEVLSFILTGASERHGNIPVIDEIFQQNE